jgi:hypothetical protein
MRTTILMVGVLCTAPSLAQEAPSVWRDPENGCVYFKLGDTLSLRYQRDGLPDCPDVKRETNPNAMDSAGPSSVTRDDVRDVTRAIESLNRKIDDVRKEFERRERF